MPNSKKTTEQTNEWQQAITSPVESELDPPVPPHLTFERKMPYKKAGSISTATETNGGYEKRFEYHAAVAGTLMVMAIVARFVIPKVMGVEAASVMDLSYLGYWLGAKVVWVWACMHLAMHFRLSAAWGLWGLLFLVGVAVIVWAGIQKPKWDLAKARRPQKSSSYKGDPDSLY